MDIDAAFQKAFAAHRAGRLAEAEVGYVAIVAVSEHPLSLHNLGVIRDGAGRIEEAGDAYRRAAGAAADDPRRQFALGVHLRMVRRLDEAEAAYRRTLALAPGYPKAAFDLGCVLVAQGRFDEGWALYEQRAARERMLARNLAVPEWRGEPLAGKRLYIWREQGFGDQILAARFLPLPGAQRVTYAGQAPLRRLFEPLGVDFVEAAPAGPEPSGHDYWTLPLSLPHHLGAMAETLPSSPYLSGRAKPGGGRIGVVTRGAADNPNDRFRALPPEAAERLCALPGAISLDPADTGAADFQDTADIIAGLDLVISVDTAVAHLAGAMGRPVWVLLARHALDWQWPREEPSPWYPSARLFVQPQAGDWASVVDQVVRDAAP
ncbi:glycosyltransferase family 9 protein [Phenylobacterium sp.]|uniref:glycosyltransferase family 9 protein n=1 Tax=Phenylobacterium sp. TaxID=1871053 RepID=UPI002E353D40|nr:glycosyltransferase family 9 protein [Phenylobacterium sp.]HEX3363601.1 glycosyltransferase family 9 protein [Phenylobacterium sp.]